ncbi:hypothetical protein I7I48_02622 [Histoplasma ohiense]|nr:hypothetical protein I7I48_02622 [Histoplasma ohiense (nom. inval.)]
MVKGVSVSGTYDKSLGRRHMHCTVHTKGSSYSKFRLVCTSLVRVPVSRDDTYVTCSTAGPGRVFVERTGSSVMPQYYSY